MNNVALWNPASRGKFSEADWSLAAMQVRRLSGGLCETPALTLFFKRVETSAISAAFGIPTEGVWLFGSPGSGKTTAAMEVRRRLDCAELLSKSVRPTLYLSLLPHPTMYSIVRGLLTILQYPFAPSTRFDELVPILFGALRSLGVRVILIDEVQHICEGNRPTILREILDLFKRLFDVANVCLVLIGTESAQKLKDADAQLASRMPGEIRLKFDFQRKEAQAFASKLIKGTPGTEFTPKAIEAVLDLLSTREDATTRLLSKIVRESVLVAALTKSPIIDVAHVRHAIGIVLLKSEG